MRGTWTQLLASDSLTQSMVYSLLTGSLRLCFQRAHLSIIRLKSRRQANRESIHPNWMISPLNLSVIGMTWSNLLWYLPSLRDHFWKHWPVLLQLVRSISKVLGAQLGILSNATWLTQLTSKIMTPLRTKSQEWWVTNRHISFTATLSSFPPQVGLSSIASLINDHPASTWIPLLTGCSLPHEAAHS